MKPRGHILFERLRVSLFKLYSSPAAKGEGPFETLTARHKKLSHFRNNTVKFWWG